MTKDYYTVKEYCEIIRDYVLTLENLGLQDGFNPRQEILTLIENEDSDPHTFPTLLMDVLGRTAKTLNDIRPGGFHFPNWRGDNGESLGKETFVPTMQEVWPELGL